MFTYPNQKILHINKPAYTENFLTIGIDEWAKASKLLSPNTFKLYLYASGNKDSFDLALSRQAVMNLLGISKDSYIRGVKELLDKGYLVPKQGNIYDFYTSPMCAEMQPSDAIDEIMCAWGHTPYTQTCVHDICADATNMYAAEITEKNKTNNYKETDNNLASLDTANAVPFYKRKKKEEKKDRWFVKNHFQDSIFCSLIYGDEKIMTIIKEIYEENGNSFTADDIVCDERLADIDSGTILDYVKEVLEKPANEQASDAEEDNEYDISP